MPLKSFLSAAELAALALPGLPATESGVWRAANRSGWTGRPRAGQGGGLEYAIDLIPAEARAAYVARHIGAVELPNSTACNSAAGLVAAASENTASDARDARLAILKLSDRIAAEAKIGRKRADRHFCDLYNAGTLDVAAWIKEQVRKVTPRTLARWRSHASNGQTARLAVDRGASRLGKGVLDLANGGDVKNYALALLAKQPQLTAHHARDARGSLPARYGSWRADAAAASGSYRSIRLEGVACRLPQ